jgi:hypothetical protein
MPLSSVRTRVSTLALVAASLATAGSAVAQATPPHPETEGPSQVRADALFSEGRDLLEKGRFPEACAKLARSEELSPAVGTLLNLAYCYEQVGKLRSAMDSYVEAETLAIAAGEAKRASFARERYVAVEPRAAKLVVRLMPPEAPGLEIRRNGVAVPRTDLGQPIPIDPQDYVVSATAPGRVPWRGALVVRGDGAVVTVIVPPLEVAAVAKTAEPAQAIGARRIAALGLGVVSAVALGAGVGVGLAAKSRYDDTGSHCDATGCDETGTTIQRGAVAQGNVATGLVVFGALAGAAGVYLWVVGAPETKEKANAPKVRVGVSPFGAALGGLF